MASSPNRKKLIQLVQKYLAGKATQEEKQFLEAYYNVLEKEPGLLDNLKEEQKAALSRDMKAAIWRQIENRERPVTIPFFKRTAIRVAMAAAILLLISIPAYYFITGPASKTTMAGVVQKQSLPIVPGGDKATLTLADGTIIVLDSAQNGTLAQQGHTVVKKIGGQLQYDASHASVTPDSYRVSSSTYNTISTPRGGQYHIILSDGSHVWLNAASSIRFPTAFTGDERLVEVSGEAYFEVTKNQHQPFKVAIAPQGAAIEVLGTHFNVNAYTDEGAVRTTLLEGSVKISSKVNGQWSMLKPGQQAISFHQSPADSYRLTIHDNIDLDAVIAWKNGLFSFDNADIQTIMRQLSRWYQVQVEYKGNIPSRHFAGQVARSASLQQVLKILELSKVHFTIEGDRVTVMP